MVHPESHSWLTERREFCSSGNTCAVWAAGGRAGCRSMIAVWLDVSVVPSGSWTVVDVLGVVDSVGVSVVMKWLEHPLSRKADVLVIKLLQVEVGESDDVVAVNAEFNLSVALVLFSSAPVCQFGFGYVRRSQILSTPPILFSAVASFLWLGPGFLQLALLWILSALKHPTVPWVWQ